MVKSTERVATISSHASPDSRKRRADSFDSDVEIDIFDLLERSRRCTIILSSKTSTPLSTSSTPSLPHSATPRKGQRQREASVKPVISKLSKPPKAKKVKQAKAKREPAGSAGRPLPRAGVDDWVETPRRKFRLVRSAESEVSQSLDLGALSLFQTRSHRKCRPAR